MQCTRCKAEGHLSRLKRVGFLQEYVLSLAGYYPWRCSSCTQSIFLRARSTVEGFTRESESNPQTRPANNKDDLHRVR